MKTEHSQFSNQNVIGWIFAIPFIAIGILNIILVHLVPGMFYLVLSLGYLPATNSFLKKRFDISISFAVKVAVALVVLWGTLGVSDLAEILGL